jgi:hypothetical protein
MTMKRINYFKMFFILIALIIIDLLNISCEKKSPNLPLTYSDTTSFTGTFKTIDDNSNNSGVVTLQIFNKSYFCVTNLPFGHGAGNLKIDNTSIDFVDTLFFGVPAMYGPAYVLSGKHNYTYDGENLTIWKNKNVGEIKYDLKIVKNN